MRPATGHNGSSGVGEAPTANTKNLPSQGRWNEPFNDLYVDITITRDEVRLRIPISEIVQRIAAIAKTAILGNAGRMAMPDGEVGEISTLGPRHLPQAADRILRLIGRKRRQKRV